MHHVKKKKKTSIKRAMLGHVIDKAVKVLRPATGPGLGRVSLCPTHNTDYVRLVSWRSVHSLFFVSQVKFFGANGFPRRCFPRINKSKYRSRPFPAHLCFLTAADFLLFLLERVTRLSRYYPR